MTGAALGMPSRCRSTPTTPEIMGTPIQFVAGRRAYRDSARRRVNYNFRYGWRLLHDPPLAPIARLHGACGVAPPTASRLTTLSRGLGVISAVSISGCPEISRFYVVNTIRKR